MKVTFACFVPNCFKSSNGNKVPMATKVPIATKVPMATKSSNGNEKSNGNKSYTGGFGSYEIWACLDIMAMVIFPTFCMQCFDATKK